MIKNKEKDLLRRIANLAKQNRDLHEVVKNLSDENRRLTEKYDETNILLKKCTGEKVEKIRKEIARSSNLKFDVATILFADILGFKGVSARNDSKEIMDELDKIYIQFNQIIKKYRIEKIKTIGDTFMCAGGVPEKNITNPIQVVLAALDMMHFINIQPINNGDGKIWDLQIGIHTGPVVALKTGLRKASYEMKGDSVNIASRIRASATEGKILISIMTYEMIKEFFSCEYYGRMPVKYKGDLEMYEVKGIKPEYSVNAEGLRPNHAFHVKYELIQFTDIQEIILDKLEKESPAYLYYHNVKHTVDVVTESELIGYGEGLNDEDLLLLKTAALFHDVGHVISYDDHEHYSAEIARKMLPSFNYTKDQIHKICELIMVTKLPPNPTNLLEQIMCDSDLDYLGRSDFIPVSNTLFKELKARDKIGTFNEWNKLQLKFISGHQYFTSTARNLREVNKQKQIKRIKELIEEEAKNEY